MATDPLLSTAELETWLRLAPGALATDAFAIAVIGAASLLVREAGDVNWTDAPAPVAPDVAVPPRAKLIATLKAKTYYENPDGNKSETTGPISETKIADVVHNMTLTDEEKAVLAALAGILVPGTPGAGLWIQPVGGADEAWLPDDWYVTDQSGSDWEIPWASLGDNLYPREIL